PTTDPRGRRPRRQRESVSPSCPRNDVGGRARDSMSARDGELRLFLYLVQSVSGKHGETTEIHPGQAEQSARASFQRRGSGLEGLRAGSPAATQAAPSAVRTVTAIRARRRDRDVSETSHKVLSRWNAKAPTIS